MSLTEFAADSGAKTIDQVDTAAETFAVLELDAIVEDPRNPRTSFDLPRLEEMAETIRGEGGVNQPILVRPLPASRLQETFEGRRKGAPLPTHELVDGARRFRASKLAGKTTIPAMIRRMTDAQVLEAQLITALQRDGLSELDEAAGYLRLVEESGIPKEDIGGKIGRSRSYVYQRLKLLDMTAESRKALLEGEIDASRALLIARIPDSKLQAKALTEAMRKGYSGSPALSVREFERWLHDNVMLKLDQARFDIKDETLHATAGACKACPKRTGAQPDIFIDVQGADICTDPKCFNSKASVHRDRLVAKAEAKGLTVVEGKAAKEICRQWTSDLQGYSRLDQKRTDVDDSGPTLRKLLGKDAPSPVLIENPYTKELIEAVPTAEAEALLVTKGQIKPEAAKSGKLLEDKIVQLRHRAESEIEQAGRDAMMAAVKEFVRVTPDDAAATLLVPELIRVWLIRQIQDMDAGDTLIEVLHLAVADGASYTEREQIAVNAIQAASDSNVFRALVLFMAADEVRFYSNSSRNQSTPALAAIAAVGAVDLDGPANAAKADRKKQLRNDIAELKAKMAPKPAKKAAAPKPEQLKAKGEKKSTAPPAAQKIRAKKPTAQEVQGQIAAALQAAEKEKEKAPDGAGLEGAADAAQDQIQAPDGAGKEEAADAAALSPQSYWPFPKTGRP